MVILFKIHEREDMSNSNEIFFNFPLRRNKINTIITDNLFSDENKIEESLQKFYKLNEDTRNDEWNQEYFLIYNSYTLDNR